MENIVKGERQTRPVFIVKNGKLVDMIFNYHREDAIIDPITEYKDVPIHQTDHLEPSEFPGPHPQQP
jgi:hypothetical protein